MAGVGYGMRGHVLWDAQNSYGTSKVTSQHAVPIINETIVKRMDHLTDGGMYGRYGESPHYEGPHRVEGSISMESHPIAIGHLLKSVFGQVTTTSDTGLQSHEFIPRNTADWDDFAAGQPVTMEIARAQSSTESAALYYDMVGNNISFSIANGQLLKVSADFLGGGFSRKAAATPSFPSAEPFRWAQASASFNGWGLQEIRDLTVNLRNQLEIQYTLNNTNTPRRIKRTGPYMVEVSGRIQFASHSLWIDFEPFNSAPTRFFTTFTGRVSPYAFTLDVPSMRLTAFEPNISGAGIIEASFSARGEFNTSSSYALRALLVNTQTYY
jgi:hypothetical protein